MGCFTSDQGSFQKTAIFHRFVSFIFQKLILYRIMIHFLKCKYITGERMAEGQGEGQVAIVEYRDEDEGEVPYLMLIKEAVIEEKQ